jgi:hypothetical protein
MAWPFQTTESKEQLRQEEQQFIREEEAARRLADLFIRHYGMEAPEIVDELERIHQFSPVPIWAPSGETGGYFHQLVKELSDGQLTAEETSRLVAMLSWPELQAHKDRGAPTCLVLAAIRHPAESYIPTLSEHAARLEKEIKTLPSSQYRTDVASEIRLTKSAIQACRVGP